MHACICQYLKAYFGGTYNPEDGRICVLPTNASQVARFDPATKTWDTFGDKFPQTTPFGTHDKWWVEPALSSFDKCMYALPGSFGVVHRILKVDSVNNIACEVGEDLRSRTRAKTWAWAGAVAGSDGCIYGIPCQANSVLRFDPRINKVSTFGEIQFEDPDWLKKMHATGVLPACWVWDFFW